MKVPLLDLSAQHDPLHDALMASIDRVLRSQTFILGPEVEKFENAIAAYCGTQFAIGVSSGTDALLVVLMALGINPGDEVITSSYSFFATAGVIARLNARPVFVDIDPATYMLHTDSVKKAITSKTKAIIPVHLFGQCADITPLLDLAKHHEIPVVEDAAQAIGAEYKGFKRAGSMGIAGCLSFFPSKNLGAMGDAGMVLTQDAMLADKIKTLRVHGAKNKYRHTDVGGNFRLDEFQAAILSFKFSYLEGWTRKRQGNAAYYETLFGKTTLLKKGLVRLPVVAYAHEELTHPHVFNQFVIRADRRDALRLYLKEKEIGCEVYYPIPLPHQECFKSLGYKTGDFPHAEQASAESLALPIYPELTKSMQETVVQTIHEFYLA